MSESDANEPANETRWLTTGEAAEILGTSIATVRRMADSGVLVSKRLPSWSSRGADRRGYGLDGHRRVSGASVDLAMAEMADRERQAKEADERHRQARIARLDEQITRIDTHIAELTAKRRTYQAKAKAGQGLAQSRIANIDEKLADLSARRKAIRKTKIEQNRMLAAHAVAESLA